MSAKLANRVHFITGADPFELLKGRDGKLQTARGKPYTIPAYKRRQREHANPPPDTIQLLSSEVAARSRELLRKAAKRGLFAIAYRDILDAIANYELKHFD